jgi:hypothetical protein
MIHDNQPGLEKSSGIASIGQYENGLKCTALFFESQNQDLAQRAKSIQTFYLERSFHELQNKVAEFVA